MPWTHVWAKIWSKVSCHHILSLELLDMPLSQDHVLDMSRAFLTKDVMPELPLECTSYSHSIGIFRWMIVLGRLRYPLKYLCWYHTLLLPYQEDSWLASLFWHYLRSLSLSQTKIMVSLLLTVIVNITNIIGNRQISLLLFAIVNYHHHKFW